MKSPRCTLENVTRLMSSHVSPKHMPIVTQCNKYAITRRCYRRLLLELIDEMEDVSDWKRKGSGDSRGLQNRRSLSLMAMVGSTPTRFRQFSSRLACPLAVSAARASTAEVREHSYLRSGDS